MGFTLKERRERIKDERVLIKTLQADMARMRASIKQARGYIKMHQEVIKDERKIAQVVKEDHRRLRDQVRAQKQAKRMHARIERIAKMEAKLASLKAAA